MRSTSETSNDIFVSDLTALRGKRVWVGLSGGVDSAVSALLLKRAGAEVTGVFIKGWYPPEMPCTWAEDRRDAMRVAAKLHIPFRTIDASAAYKREVIEYLLAEYRAGRTPNPDMFCNKEIKFGVFYREALAVGVDYIATGHYLSGEKDQRYFLAFVSREALAKTVFPVGRMDKRDVRSIASRAGLPVAKKRDSQGICFLGSISVKDFLKQELGENNPALLYTLGERAALPEGPWYVVGKDIQKGEVRVSRERTPATNTIRFDTPNWLATPPQYVEAQYRFRGPRLRGTLKGDRFESEEPLHEFAAPGQAIVFYHHNVLLGGARIIE